MRAGRVGTGEFAPALEDRDDFAGQDVALVLGPFLRGKLALVALAGQLVHAGAGLGVRLEADELAPPRR